VDTDPDPLSHDTPDTSAAVSDPGIPSPALSAANTSADRITSSSISSTSMGVPSLNNRGYVSSPLACRETLSSSTRRLLMMNRLAVVFEDVEITAKVIAIVMKSRRNVFASYSL